MSKKKNHTRWSSSDLRASGWWMNNSAGRGYESPCGVVFVENRWWFFGMLYPGFELPVWLRSESWLKAHLVDRERALEQADGFIRTSMSKPDIERLSTQHPVNADFNRVIRSKTLAFERRIVDEVYEAVKNQEKPRRFQIRLDRPDGNPA